MSRRIFHPSCPFCTTSFSYLSSLSFDFYQDRSHTHKKILNYQDQNPLLPLPVVRCPQLSRPEPVAIIASCQLSVVLNYQDQNPLLSLPVVRCPQLSRPEPVATIASCQLSSTIKTRTRCYHCQLSVVRCPQLSRPEPVATIASCQLSVVLNYQDLNKTCCPPRYHR
jgi:hypothetical protein